ncbi:hypothetical protein GmHk_11G032433 [Glycine max]|nr:hypothetical protein GmHk_11G032433 [Glycine max]
MVKLMCGSHNHELGKSLVGHPYASRLTKDEKIIIADMTKSMVKPRNILLMLKEHNDNSYTIIKQVYNARNAYRSSIRGNNTEMQQLMKLLERDQYIHWHRLKDKDVVHSTYKTNRYRLSLLDIVGVTSTGMPFSAAFSYLEGDRNVKTKCKILVGKKNAWDYMMEARGSLVDCPCEQQFDEYLKKFEIACSPWPMVESAHWALKRLLQNSLVDLCSVWEAMNNMIMLQHTEIKASFETSTHVVGHVFKVTLYNKLLGMVSRYALNQIVAEYKCMCNENYTWSSLCMELARYVVDSIPLGWRLSFSDQGLSEPEFSITKKMETISKRFEELDVYGKKRSKQKVLRRNDDQTSKNNKARSIILGSNVVHHHLSKQNREGPCRCWINSIHPFMIPLKTLLMSIVDVKVDSNCGYRAIVVLLGMDEDSWSLVCNHLLKKLAKWSEEYIDLLGGIR